MNRVETASGQAALDRASPEPEFHELTMGDNPVLSISDLRDLTIAWSTSRSDSGFDVDHVLHLADSRQEMRACGARGVPFASQVIRGTPAKCRGSAEEEGACPSRILRR